MAANTWISYIDRSYQQIKDRVLTRLQSKTPEITDHSESNIFVKMLGIWSGIAEKLGYYIDNWGRDSFIPLTRQYSSAVLIAQSYDYRIFSNLPASTDITFYLEAINALDVVIPANTEVKSTAGYRFFTVSTATILAGNIEVTVSAIQKVYNTGLSLGLTNGSANQKILISDISIADKTAVVNIAGDVFTHVDTFAYSSPTDKVFRMTVNTDRKSILEFGDGLTGEIPVNGGEVTIDYFSCEGSKANVPAEDIVEIVSVLSVPPGAVISCTNDNQASGGANIESLAELQSRIPLSIRTLAVAVTEGNFIDIANQAPSVSQSALSFNCARVVTMYIVAVGGGIASEALCQSVNDWFNPKRRLFNVVVETYPAGNLELILVANVTALVNYQNTVVESAITSNLTTVFSMENQEIGGQINISDIYEVIENTAGVKNSNISKVSVIPYARSVQNFVPLNWNKTVKNTGTSVLTWVITLINATTYHVFRNSSFMGSFTIGSLASFPEIDFIVSAGAYTVGDSWEFKTYPDPFPALGVTQIDEFSVPVFSAINITLNVQGGI